MGAATGRPYQLLLQVYRSTVYERDRKKVPTIKMRERVVVITIAHKSTAVQATEAFTAEHRI